MVFRNRISIRMPRMSADAPPPENVPGSSNWSGEHLRHVIRHIFDYAVFSLDPEGIVTMWNPGAAQLFGYSEGEIVGKSGDILFTPEDQAAGAPHREREGARKTGASEDRRWHLRKDGTRFFASGMVRAIWDGDQLYGFTKVCRDVTAKKRMDEQLQRQARLLDLIHDPVFVWVLGGGIRYWNRAAEQLYGYSREEVEGRNPHELLKVEAAGGVSQVLSYLRRHGSWTGEVRHTLRDGSQAILDSRQVLLYQDHEQLVLESNRDITERAAVDRALRESESRLQLAIAIAQMGTFEIDFLTQAVVVNEPGQEIYGWPEPTQTLSQVLSQCHPEDRDEFLRRVKLALDPTGPGEFEVEQRIIRTDGTVRWVRVRGRVSFGEGGAELRAVRCAGTYIDITKLKEAETALRRADQRKDEFLAMLAHELRNPLAAAKNAVVLQRISGETEARAWALDVIERQTEQLARLVDDLLDVSRITSGKIRLRKRHLDAAAVLDNAVEATRFLIAERKHTLVRSYEHGSMWLEADPSRLEQIVVNLLTNAAKYTESSGRIELNAHLEQDGQTSVPTVVISVRDTGIGIPPEKLPEMFELFAQGERSIARSEGGLGIGLTIVERLTKMHGGTIAAHSEGLGKGSLFVVRLPAAVAPAARAGMESQGQAVEAVARGARVLVVDDNRDMANGLRRLLDLAGYAVEVAHDGPEALEIARQFQPASIILDIGLPGMDGYTVAATLRGEEHGRDALLIALSGYGQEEDQRRSREVGIDYHMVKPVDFGELKQLLREELERRERDR